MSKTNSSHLLHNPLFLVSPHSSRGPHHHSLGCSGYVSGEEEWQKSAILESFFSHSTPIHLHITVAQIFNIYSELTNSHHLHHYHSSPNSQSHTTVPAPNWFPSFYSWTLSWPHLQQPVWSFKNAVLCHLLLKILQSIAITLRMQYKISNMAYKILHDLAPGYPCIFICYHSLPTSLFSLYWSSWCSVSRLSILLEAVGSSHLLFPLKHSSTDSYVCHSFHLDLCSNGNSSKSSLVISSK